MELNPEPVSLDQTSRDSITWLRDTLRERSKQIASGIVERVWLYLIFLAMGAAITASVSVVVSEIAQAVVPDRVTAAAAPSTVMALSAIATAAILRIALWLGPIVVSPAELTWVVPLPVNRGWVLRPKLYRALATGALVGAIFGMIFGAIACQNPPSSTGSAFASAIPGALLGVTSVGAAVFAEVSPRWGTVVRLASPVLTLLGAFALIWPGSRRVVDVLLLAGPWGWNGWTIAGIAHDDPALWRVTYGLLIAAALISCIAAFVWLRLVRVDALAIRSGSVARAQVGIVMLDLRILALVGQSEKRARRTHARRLLPVPKSPGMVLIWRDCMSLLRHPGRLVAAVAFFASSALLVNICRVWFERAGGKPSAMEGMFIAVIMTVPLYLGTSSLLEAAKEENDFTSRIDLLPFSADRIAMTHLIVPAVLTVIGGGATVAITCLAMATPDFVLATMVLATTLAAGAALGPALWATYRGSLRYELLTIGGDWYAGLPFLIWYLTPPVFTIVGIGPLLWNGVRGTGLSVDQLTQSVLFAGLITFVSIHFTRRSVIRQVNNHVIEYEIDDEDDDSAIKT